MPVSSQSPVNSYVANGTTTIFAYNFLIFDDADLFIDIDGVEQSSGYSVSGVGVETGGNVTFSVAPDADAVVTISRNMALERLIEYQESGGFEAETVNEDIDRSVMMIQQIAARAIMAPAGDSATGSMELPSVSNRANKYLGFGADGTPGAYDPVDGAVSDAANVNFLQSGTGAVSRTVQAKLREVVTSEDRAGTVGIENVGLGSGVFDALTTSAYNVAVGYEALHSLTTVQTASTNGGNTAVGRHALYSTTRGQQNTAMGINTMLQNVIGDDNVAIGVSALENSVGDSQVAIGPNALRANTNTGFTDFNTAVGAYSQESGATGAENVSVGYTALRVNTGDYNVSIGSQSMAANTTGSNNVAVGWAALNTNTTGARNVAVGTVALTAGDTSDNTAVGYAALTNATLGFNTALGRSAGSTLTAGQYNIMIGFNAQPSSATATGEVTIGDTNVTLIRSQAGLALAGTFAVPLFNLATTGQVGVMTSSSASTALNLAAGTTAIAPIRLNHGSAPTSPVNGDMWTTTAGLYVRINGSTVGPLS